MANIAKNEIKNQSNVQYVNDSIYEWAQIIGQQRGQPAMDSALAELNAMSAAQRANWVRAAERDPAGHVGIDPAQVHFTRTNGILSIDTQRSQALATQARNRQASERNRQAAAPEDTSGMDQISDWQATTGGGGGGGGGGTPPRDPNSDPATMDDATLRQYIAGAYGYLSAFLDIPEVGTKILEAARGGWSKDRLRGALSGTEWWKNTTESMRQWDSQVILDNGSARARVDQKVAEINAELTKAGITLDPTRVIDIANMALRMGWDGGGSAGIETKNALANEALLNPEIQKQVQTSYAGIKAKGIAADYGIRISESDQSRWGTRIALGADTEENLTAYLTKQAQILFPTIADGLAEGKTVRDYMGSYLDSASEILGIDKETIDITDSKWLSALQGHTPDGKGVKPYDKQGWEYKIKTDKTYGYDYTRKAIDNAHEVGDTILRMFGKKA